MIAFTSWHGWMHNILLIDADGTNARNLTNSPEFYFQSPDWSPDGRKIAF